MEVEKPVEVEKTITPEPKAPKVEVETPVAESKVEKAPKTEVKKVTTPEVVVEKKRKKKEIHLPKKLKTKYKKLDGPNFTGEEN